MYRSPHFKCLFRKPGIDVMAGEMKKRELGMLTVRIALNTLLQSRKDYYTSPKQRKWVSTRLCYPDIFSKSNLAFSAEKQVGTSCEHSWGEPESQIRDSQIRVGQCPASAAQDLLFIISSVLGSLNLTTAFFCYFMNEILASQDMSDEMINETEHCTVILGFWVI